MAIARYAVLNAEGDVINVILADDQGTDWAPPAGHSVLVSEEASVGGTLINGVYTPPADPTPEE